MHHVKVHEKSGYTVGNVINSNTNTNCEHLETINSQLLSTLDKNRLIIEKINQTNKDLTAELDKLNKELSDDSTKIVGMEKDLEFSNQKLVEVENELSKIKKDKEDIDKKYQISEKKNAELIAKTDSEKLSYKQKIEEMTQKINVLESDKKKTDVSIKSNLELSEKLKLSEEELIKKNQTITDEKNKEIQVLKAQLNTLEDKDKKQEVKKTECTNKLNELNATNLADKALLDEYSHKLSELERESKLQCATDTKILEDKILKLEKDNNDLNIKLTQNNEECNIKVEDILEKEKNLHETTKKELYQVNSLIEKVKSDLKKSKEENNKNNECNSKLKEKNFQYEEQSKKTDELQEILKKTKFTLNTANDELLKVKKKLEDKTQSESKLIKDKDEIHNQNLKLNEVVESEKKILMENDSKMKELERKLLIINDQLDTKNKNIDQIKSEKKKLELKAIQYQREKDLNNELITKYQSNGITSYLITKSDSNIKSLLDNEASQLDLNNSNFYKTESEQIDTSNKESELKINNIYPTDIKNNKLGCLGSLLLLKDVSESSSPIEYKYYISLGIDNQKTSSTEDLTKIFIKLKCLSNGRMGYMIDQEFSKTYSISKKELIKNWCQTLENIDWSWSYVDKKIISKSNNNNFTLFTPYIKTWLEYAYTRLEAGSIDKQQYYSKYKLNIHLKGNEYEVLLPYFQEHTGHLLPIQNGLVEIIMERNVNRDKINFIGWDRKPLYLKIIEKYLKSLSPQMKENEDTKLLEIIVDIGNSV